MPRLRVAAFLAVVGLAVARLQAAGGGPLGGPRALSAVPAWLQGTDPVIASFALLRFLALALGWYVLAVTVLGWAVRACRAHRLTGRSFPLPTRTAAKASAVSRGSAAGQAPVA